MTDRDEDIPPGLRDALAALPRDRDPGAALEDRVVRALAASPMVAAICPPYAGGTWLCG